MSFSIRAAKSYRNGNEKGRYTSEHVIGIQRLLCKAKLSPSRGFFRFSADANDRISRNKQIKEDGAAVVKEKERLNAEISLRPLVSGD